MTANHIFVKPAAGLLVRDMALRDNLPPEGRMVEESAYWHRRAAEGGVTISETDPAAPAQAKKKGT